MARTRYVTNPNVIHADDGELLDKEGNPIDPVVRHEPEVEAPPAPVIVTTYLCDPTTVQRDCDGWELIRLLDLILGGVSMEVDAERFAALPADVKRHMRAVRRAVE